jgi:hypothetical protein
MCFSNACEQEEAWYRKSTYFGLWSMHCMIWCMKNHLNVISQTLLAQSQHVIKRQIKWQESVCKTCQTTQNFLSFCFSLLLICGSVKYTPVIIFLTSIFTARERTCRFVFMQQHVLDGLHAITGTVRNGGIPTELLLWHFLARKLTWWHAKKFLSFRYGGKYRTIWSAYVVTGLEIDHAKKYTFVH